jgi:hypothetical protein
MQILYSPTTQFIIISLLRILLVRSSCLYVYSQIFILVCQCISNLRRHINVCIWLIHRFVSILKCIIGQTFFRWYKKVYILLDDRFVGVPMRIFCYTLLSLVYKCVYFFRPVLLWRSKVYFWPDPPFVDIVMPPYSRVIRSKTYHGYVKPRIIPNVIYNVIFCVTYTNTVKFN